MGFSRRSVLGSICVGGALATTGKAMQSVPRFRIWDSHSHLGSLPGDSPEKRMEVLIRCADRLGIERLILSQGYSSEFHPSSADVIREENDRVLRAVRAFP